MSKQRILLNQDKSILEVISILDGLSNDETCILDIENCSAVHSYFHLRLLFEKIGRKKVYLSGKSSLLKRRWEGIGGKWIARNDEREFDENFAKTHLLAHNFTPFEYFLYEIRRLFQKVLFFFRKKEVVYSQSLFTRDSNVIILLAGLITSLTLLIFIFYFAVSKTYITITPEYKIKTIVRNIVFAPKDPSSVLDQKLTIDLRKIDVGSSLEMKFNVTALDEASAKKSYGKIELLNELRQEQILKPNTRFVTENGIVFRSVDWIRVPPTRTLSGTSTLGRAQAEVIADIYDVSGQIAGKRGNIPEGTTLTIPGLKFNQENLYARAIIPFVGGQEPTTRVITQKELDTFKNLILEKIRLQAAEDVKKTLEQQNARLGEDYALLPLSNAIRYGTGQVFVAGNPALGAPAKEVTLQAKLTSSALIYDRRATLFYMNGILGETLLYGTEKLIRVDSQSLRMPTILQESLQPLSIKATTEIDAIITYDFENNANNLTRKLKSQISGSDAKEIKQILQNDPNIAQVKVNFSPFWLTKASGNIDNIEFILEKD